MENPFWFWKLLFKDQNGNSGFVETSVIYHAVKNEFWFY